MAAQGKRANKKSRPKQDGHKGQRAEPTSLACRFQWQLPKNERRETFAVTRMGLSTCIVVEQSITQESVKRRRYAIVPTVRPTQGATGAQVTCAVTPKSCSHAHLLARCNLCRNKLTPAATRLSKKTANN
ncbi:uncharacterized protein LOC115482765 [Drosophila hydei]|uniref:Uncharacterized protein LOC115482765 n=1 Tax=Drosophila hydei TaxID=7224 RepID=A0A6J2SQX8_DROHY|nr:uncharacterized protein LOC115482765 [Drosophila hydei]